MFRSSALRRGLRVALLTAVHPAAATAQLSEALVRSYLWPTSTADFERARAVVERDASLVGLSRPQMRRVEDWMRAGPSHGAPPGVGETLIQMVVEAPGDREIPVLVRLPSVYTPDRQWPLILAMHGGPPGGVAQALRGSLSMIEVWASAAETAGWIVASPAMVDVVSRDGRTEDRLPYEIFQPEEARAVVDAVRERFSVHPNRIVSTGISLGSNFSIAYAAAHPDWFSAIVPVSTEGESREWLLRNLALVPTYVLEGAQDRNIRDVGGPRAMDTIMTSLDYDLVYREFADRAHEGFAEHYPDVLLWLDDRPRPSAPREVLRAPHRGIVSPARRVHWVETDSRQALVRARVTGETEIDVSVRWARAVTLYLNDQLVDLDREVTIRVNGEIAFQGVVERSARLALEEARRSNDERRVYAARVTVPVPRSADALTAAVAFTDDIEPTHEEGVLSFWEMYAVRALEERFPGVGFEAIEVELPDGVATAPEQVGLRVTAIDPDGPLGTTGLRIDDVILSFGAELFFAGRDGVDGLHHWLVRELRSHPEPYTIEVLREGARITLHAELSLGSYRPPEPLQD